MKKDYRALDTSINNDNSNVVTLRLCDIDRETKE